MLSLLSRWAGRKAGLDLTHLEVTVYTRAQCCCCHKAEDLLHEYQNRHRFGLQTVDIDADPALVALHGSDVPVVAVGGKVRFKGVVNPVLFERLLLAERPEH